MKFTKTATQLLYGKKVGDVIVSFRDPRFATKRESTALAALVENGYIKFLRQYSYSDNNFGHGKTVEVKERHYEVLKRPDWMDQ